MGRATSAVIEEGGGGVEITFPLFLALLLGPHGTGGVGFIFFKNSNKYVVQ